MSAGAAGGKPVKDLALLAPKFRAAVELAVKLCDRAGLDVVVHETFRSQELQALYYERGRTVIPPHYTVTNARSNLYSWHGFGLAVDVISKKHGWNSKQFFHDIAPHFRAAGCRWGGEWKMKDLPHFQWGLCRPSPSDHARALFAAGGQRAVWEAVGAD